MQKDIEKRLADLHLVLQYSSQKTEMLKIGERIMVNQERAALFRKLDFEHTDFTQSESTAKKIQNILYLIDVTGWKPVKAI